MLYEVITSKGQVQHVAAARVRTNHLMGFNQPVDIHIDKDDRIYITDQLNRRFSVWQLLTDRYLAEKPILEQDIV